MPEPLPVASDETIQRLTRILADKGIRMPQVAEIDGYSPDEPGHPEYHRRRRVEVAEQRWSTVTPPRYRDATATDPRVTEWAAAVVADPTTAGSILVTGTTGTGKTHQAYGALRMIASLGVSRYEVIATTSADMYGLLRPSSGNSAEYELKRLCEIPLLLLDDLGSAKASEWTEEVTYRLVNHRYNHCLPTVFTSNLPPRARNGAPDLSSTLGERITSRLAEMVTVVAMAGADRRRAA
jgi:DNA replication protein DnaC